jgi:nitroreductase
MVNKFINRNSVRNYRKQPIENEKILKIKEVINASPTAMNFQSFSAIFVTDQNTKNELMKLN